MKAPSEVEIRAALGVAGLHVPSVSWTGFVVCVVRRVVNGTSLWDAVEECAQTYK